MFEYPRNPTVRMLRQFGVAGLVVFGLLLGGPALLKGRTTAGGVLLAAGVVLGLLAVFAPRWLRGPFLAAMAITAPLGWLLSQVMLGLLFFGVFTPLAWWFRLRGRDLLQLRRAPAGASYWRPKTQPADLRRYLRQY